MSFWTNIKESIKDISSLEVLTFTGKVSAVIKEGEGGSLINWEELIELAKADGTVNLVGATKIEFDKDVRQFIATGVAQNLIDLHQATVESSQEARQGMINMVVEGVKKP